MIKNQNKRQRIYYFTCDKSTTTPYCNQEIKPMEKGMWLNLRRWVPLEDFCPIHCRPHLKGVEFSHGYKWWFPDYFSDPVEASRQASVQLVTVHSPVFGTPSHSFGIFYSSTCIPLYFSDLWGEKTTLFTSVTRHSWIISLPEHHAWFFPCLDEYYYGQDTKEKISTVDQTIDRKSKHLLS